MKKYLIAVLLFWSVNSWAQSFPTDSGALVPGYVLLVPDGNHINSQATYGPVTTSLPLPVVCESGCTGGGGSSTVIQGAKGSDSTADSWYVQPGAGASFPVTGTFWQATQPISAAALPLPAGAATVSGQGTINTTLGNPFQAGGSIGNTAFIANAGTNLNTSSLALETGGNLATLAGAVSASKFNVNISSGNPTSITANAGTNLNTSSLALESGGNLATIANSLGGCAGQTVANTSVTAINNAGSSSNLKLVSKASAKNVYVCSINLVAGAATNVALVDGTKTTNECDTSTAGMAGGATAGTGWNLAANGGIALGNGTGIVSKTTGTNLDVCLLFSAGNQVSGSVTWAQF